MKATEARDLMGRAGMIDVDTMVMVSKEIVRLRASLGYGFASFEMESDRAQVFSSRMRSDGYKCRFRPTMKLFDVTEQPCVLVEWK